MIVEWLILIIAFLSWKQKDEGRKDAAMILAIFTLSHDVFLSNWDGLAYYGSAALFDLGVITCVANLPRTPKLVNDILNISRVSMFLNCLGWIIWMNYWEPWPYNAAFVFLYCWTIVVLVKDEGAYRRDHALDRWSSFFRFTDHPGNYCNHRF